MPVWLVTGGSGFLGRHLLEALDALACAGSRAGRARTPTAPELELGVVRRARPDTIPRPWPGRSRRPRPTVVFHLAGRTPPATAEEYYRGNTLATVHLLDALRGLRRTVRVVLAGSAAELGPLAAEDLPVAEDYRCRPADSYGLSKFLATTAGLAARPPLEVITARIFNPIGPGLPRTQAFGRFAALLAEPGPDPLRLTVGDLDARRDFIDVRDVARALLSLAGGGDARHGLSRRHRPVAPRRRRARSSD